VNSVLEEILATGLVRTADGQPVSLRFNVDSAEREFLRSIVADTRPSTSLEIGLAFGISALCICDALRADARHIIVDPFQFTDFKGIGLLNLERAGYRDRIDFYELLSHRALPKIEESGVRIDFALVDGGHDFDQVLVDFFNVDRLLKIGGVVVFDDVDWGSVRKACRYVAINRAYEVCGCVTPNYDSGSQKLSQRALHLLPGSIRRPLRRILRPEIVIRDNELGIEPASSMIAFRKTAETLYQSVDFKQF
jgi:predicted O-methyltransferase YrrM